MALADSILVPFLVGVMWAVSRESEGILAGLVALHPLFQPLAADDSLPAQGQMGHSWQAQQFAVEGVLDVGLRAAQQGGDFSDCKDFLGCVRHCSKIASIYIEAFSETKPE